MHQCLSHLTLVHIISLNPFNGPLIRSFNKKCIFFRIIFNNKEKCDRDSMNSALSAKVSYLRSFISVDLHIKTKADPWYLVLLGSGMTTNTFVQTETLCTRPTVLISQCCEIIITLSPSFPTVRNERDRESRFYSCSPTAHFSQITGNKKPSRSWVCLALISHHELICGNQTLTHWVMGQRGLSID